MPRQTAVFMLAVVGGLCSACAEKTVIPNATKAMTTHLSRSRPVTASTAASPPTGAAAPGLSSAASSAPIEMPISPAPRVPLSSYGHFDVSIGGNSECVLTYDLQKRGARILFSVPRCDGEGPGMTLNATEKSGLVKFPIVGDNGDEFHLFEIMTSRGGNGPGNDYWIVVVRASDVWSAELPQGQLMVTDLPEQKSPLVLEDPATTTAQGTRCTVLFGKAKTRVLPILPSHTVGTETRTVDGELFGGYHYTNWQPVLSTASGELIIDDPGKCSLPELGVEGGKVRMTVAVTTFSDGRTQVRCLSVR